MRAVMAVRKVCRFFRSLFLEWRKNYRVGRRWHRRGRMESAYVAACMVLGG